MTLLVQTDGRIKQRKERRKAAREGLLHGAIEAALDAAFAEVERIQTPLVNVTVTPGAPAPSSGGAGPDSIGAGPARVPFQIPGTAAVQGAEPAAGAAVGTDSLIISDARTSTPSRCRACLVLRRCSSLFHKELTHAVRAVRAVRAENGRDLEQDIMLHRC